MNINDFGLALPKVRNMQNSRAVFFPLTALSQQTKQWHSANDWFTHLTPDSSAYFHPLLLLFILFFTCNIFPL